MPAFVVLLAAHAPPPIETTAIPPAPPLYYAPPAPPPPPPSSGPRRPVLTNAWEVIRGNDYPKAERMAGIEGGVRYRIAVSRKGKARACTIVESSGNTALDERTCKVVVERARFQPARDAAGQAVAGDFAGRIVWRVE